jgi:hypothetical protein
MMAEVALGPLTEKGIQSAIERQCCRDAVGGGKVGLLQQ